MELHKNFVNLKNYTKDLKKIINKSRVEIS